MCFRYKSLNFIYVHYVFLLCPSIQEPELYLCALHVPSMCFRYKSLNFIFVHSVFRYKSLNFIFVHSMFLLCAFATRSSTLPFCTPCSFYVLSLQEPELYLFALRVPSMYLRYKSLNFIFVHSMFLLCTCATRA